VARRPVQPRAARCDSAIESVSRDFETFSGLDESQKLMRDVRTLHESLHGAYDSLRSLFERASKIQSAQIAGVASSTRCLSPVLGMRVSE
jgi:hypothetical protein